MEPDTPASERVEQIRQHLTDEAQDEDGYLTPSKQSELVALTDEEVMRLYRKIAFDNSHQWTAIFEHEMRGRLIQALGALRESS